MLRRNLLVWMQQRSLQTKAWLSLISLMLLMLIVMLGISYGVIWRGFLSLEQRDAQANVERITNRIEAEKQAIRDKLGDWAAWDDAWNYLKSRDKSFEVSNLQPETLLDNIRMDLLFFIDLDGRMVHSSQRMLPNQKASPASVDFERYFLDPSKRSLWFREAGQQGLIGLGSLNWILVSQPITSTDRRGEIRGYAVMGRQLNVDMVTQWSEELRYQLIYNPDKAANNTDVKWQELSEQKLQATLPVRDIEANVIVQIDAIFEREISARGRHTIGIINWVFAGTMQLIGGLSLWLISQLTRYLRTLVGGISQSEKLLSHVSTDLSATSHAVASGALQASASLSETVQCVQILSNVVNMNSQAAKQALQLAETSAEKVILGEKEVATLVQGIENIAQSSSKIVEIIKVIDGIAQQTNLLALNAAVEAARAGEQGKGFAVVADAVRKLAINASQAAHEISSLIKNSVAKTHDLNLQAQHSRAVLKEILEAAKRFAEISKEITHASEQQSQGIVKIHSYIQELEDATHRNSESSTQVENSSNNMMKEAHALNQLVQRLNQLVGGAA